MNDLLPLLREGDPLQHDPRMTPVDAARVREAMRAVAPGGRFPVAVARFAVAGVTVASIGLAVLCFRFAHDAPPSGKAVHGDASLERRQLQFVTPGGTRIIWTFDPAFETR